MISSSCLFHFLAAQGDLNKQAHLHQPTVPTPQKKRGLQHRCQGDSQEDQKTCRNKESLNQTWLTLTVNCINSKLNDPSSKALSSFEFHQLRLTKSIKSCHLLKPQCSCHFVETFTSKSPCFFKGWCFTPHVFPAYEGRGSIPTCQYVPATVVLSQFEPCEKNALDGEL